MPTIDEQWGATLANDGIAIALVQTTAHRGGSRQRRGRATPSTTTPPQRGSVDHQSGDQRGCTISTTASWRSASICNHAEQDGTVWGSLSPVALRWSVACLVQPPRPVRRDVGAVAGYVKVLWVGFFRPCCAAAPCVCSVKASLASKPKTTLAVRIVGLRPWCLEHPQGWLPFLRVGVVCLHALVSVQERCASPVPLVLAMHDGPVAPFQEVPREVVGEVQRILRREPAHLLQVPNRGAIGGEGCPPSVQ